jgi:hypothetical protein
MKDVYERFGKYLLSHLGIVDDPDALDWEFIVKGYTQITKRTKPGLMYINWLVANHFGVDASEVRSIKTNKPNFTTPKHTTMYLATTLFRYTQDEIRDFYHLNIQNRSSVANALTKIEGWLQTDKHFKEDVEHITNILLGYEQIYKRPITDTIGVLGSIQKANIPEGNSMPIDGNRKV